MRKNLFCPNLSLPENKALVEKLGLFGFYKEYVKNNYNIPNEIYEDLVDTSKSIEDLIYINRDLFTKQQQDQVVDSILYWTQEYRNSGLDNVSEIKNLIKENFEYDIDEYSKFGEEYSDIVTSLQNILDNFDSFFNLVNKKLSSQDITVETNDNLDFNNEESSYDSAENLNQKLNYSDESSFKQSSKDTASANLKIALSLIPKYVYENGDVVLDENSNAETELTYIGSPTFEPMDVIWNDLLYTLVDVPIGSKLDYLKNSTNPRHRMIAKHIEENPDISLVNQFESVFSKQQAKFVTVVYSRPDKSGVKSIKVIDTNRLNADNLLIDIWYEDFLNSPYISNINGNKRVNNTKGKELLEEYNAVLKTLKTDLNKGLQDTRSLLSKIGINISMKALNSDGIWDGNQNLTPRSIIENNLKYIFNRIAGDQVENETTEDILELNNPFIDENSTLNLLAKLENKANPNVFEASFVGGDGKARYSFVNNTYASHKVRQLKTDLSYLNKLKSTAYASGSYYLNKLISDPNFREVFNLYYVDSLGNDSNNQENKTFARMNTKEKELTKVALFQNAGKGTTISNSNIGQFIGLVPSDKTTTPIFKTLKVDVKVSPNTDSNGNYNFNSETFEVIYEQFMSEYNRVKQTLSEIGNTDIRQIAEYHTGAEMGRRFIVFPFMNSLMFDNRNLLELDDVRIRDIVKPRLQKFLSDLTKDQIKYWKEIGIYPNADNYNNFFDKSYASKVGIKMNKPTNEELTKFGNAFAANYAVNQFIFMMNQTQLISGDPALHGKSVIRDLDPDTGSAYSKTWVNFYKRMAKDIAPGTDGNFGDNGNYNTIFLKDLNYKSEQLLNYNQKVSESIGSNYAKINPADAQEYTTLDEHLNVMRAYGRATQEIEDAVSRLKAGESNINDIKLVLQPMKPVYVNSQIEGGINTMYYIKSSSFPLIPALTKGLEIDKLRQFMESNNIQRAAYESAAKLGIQGNLTEVSKDGVKWSDNLDINNTTVINLSRSGFRLQQEMPYHGMEGDINEGSQGRKLVLNNLEYGEVIKYNGKDYTGSEVKDIFERLHIEKMDRSLNQLITDLGFNLETGKLEDITKIHSILQEEAESRDYPIADLYSIQLVEENGRLQFKIPLSFTNNATRFESILNSLFTNRVLRSELPGFMGIQGASSGFQSVMSNEDLSGSIIESGITWLNPNDTKLNYIREDDNGDILSADILVPNYLGVKLSEYILEDGTLDTTKIPEDILTIIGLRIPTQGFNSMMKFKVKGFLPDIVGDLVVVPAEVTIQMGSDFDVDKLFIYRYHFNKSKDGSLKKITADFDTNIIVEEKSGTDLVKLINEEAAKIDKTFSKVNLIGVSRITNYDDLDYKDIENILKLYVSKDIDLSNDFAESVNDNYDVNLEEELYSQVAKKILDKIENVQIDINQRITNIDYSKLSEKQIDNLIIQTFEDRLSDKRIMDQILTPNGFGKLPEVADNVAKLVGGSQSEHTFTTRDQNSISKVNIEGKGGTAQFSLFSTFFKASQDANLSVSNEYSFNIKNSKNEVVTLNSLSTLNNIEGDKKSDVIMYLQSAAVDNAKEQILGKLNINDYTMGVAGTMAMLGFPEDFIGYFLSQPVLTEFSSLMEGSNDIVSGVSDPSAKIKVIQDLKDSLGTFDKVNNYKYTLGVSDLVSELSEKSDIQIEVLKTFEKLLNLADNIQSLQSAINTDTKGLGASYSAIQAKTMQIMRLFNNPDGGVNAIGYPILNARNLVDNNTVAKANETLLKANELLGSIYTYNSASYVNIINNILSEASLSPTEANLKDIYSNLKSFILTNPELLNLEEVNTVRDSLLYGKDNLAERWSKYSKSDLGKRNPLTKRITPKFAKNNEDYNGVKALNSPASNNSHDIDNMMGYFYDMLNSSDNVERQLGEDLVRYHILTGAQFGSQSIGKYITFDVLEKYNFSKKLRDIDKLLKDSQVFDSFVRQYFQNNPFKATTFDIEQIGGKISEVITVPLNNNQLRNKNNEPVAYFSVYDSNNRTPVLYERSIMSPSGIGYTKIPVTGNKFIKKYDYLDNNVGAIYNQQREILPKTQTEDSEISELTIEQQLQSRYGGNNSVSEILDNIVNKSNNPYFVRVATDLLNSNALNEVNFEYSEDRVANGWYNSSNNTIYINPNAIKSTGLPLLDKFEEVFLHELLHAGTVNSINNYDRLPDNQKKAVKKIERLYKQYIDNHENKEELDRYTMLNELRLSGDKLNKDDMDFLTNNKSKYYHLTNVKEFIAAGLTNPEVRTELEAKDLWTRILDFIADLLGINSNDLEFLYQSTLDIIDNNQQSNEINEDLFNSNEEYNRLEFVRQRDEFLRAHKTFIGKRITDNTLQKFIKSQQEKSKYNRLKIRSWNGELRVSRVDPIYEDISEGKQEKESPKERAINSLLDRLKESLKRFQKRKIQLGDEVDTVLDNNIAKLENRIKDLEGEKSIANYMRVSESKINDISDNINSYDDVESVNDALSYTSALNRINETLEFTEEFDEWNNRLNGIAAKASSLNKKLLKKASDLMSGIIKSNIGVDYNVSKALNQGVKEVGFGESLFLDPSQSSSEDVQIIGYLIERYQFDANQEHDTFNEEFIPLVQEYRDKYKNDYTPLLQLDEKGKPTGFLLNKYKDAFYKESKGKKEYQFNDIEFTKASQERYERELKSAYDNLSPQDYLAWEANNNPYTYMEAWKLGKKPNQTGARRFLTITPKSEWIDPNYTKLKSLPESDPARRLYEFIDPILRRNNKRYQQQANYIPELQKSASELLLEGKAKESFKGLKEEFADTFNNDDKVVSDIDILTGEPRLYIPVSMFGNKLDLDRKSLDLAKITEKVKYQEISLKYKFQAEPILNLYYAILKSSNQFHEYDESGNPITMDKPATRLLEHSQFIIQNYLYNKTREDSDTERKLGKITDKLIDYTRVVGMGWNPFSAIGNITQGLTSNFTFASGNQYFNKKEGTQATSLMMHTLAGNSNTAKKINKMFTKFDAFVKSNELNFGKSKELASATKSKWKSALEPYEFQQRGEHFIQGQTMLGILLNTKIDTPDGNKISLFEGYDENGKWKSEYGEDPMADKTRLFKMTQKIRKAIIDVHGNYSRPIQAKKDFYWRAAMIFRTWLPQAINTRFGAESTDILLDITTKGRYRSYSSIFKDKDGKIDLGALRDNLKYFIGLTGNTSLSEIDKVNMRKNFAELAMIVAISLAVMALKAGLEDLDDDEKLYTTYIINSMSRVNGELTFFMLPSSFKQISQDPIPLMRTLDQTIDLLPASWNYIIGEDEYKTGVRKGRSKLGKEITDVIPFITQIDKNWTYMNQVFEDR